MSAGDLKAAVKEASLLRQPPQTAIKLSEHCPGVQNTLAVLQLVLQLVLVQDVMPYWATSCSHDMLLLLTSHYSKKTELQAADRPAIRPAIIRQVTADAATGACCLAARCHTAIRERACNAGRVPRCRGPLCIAAQVPLPAATRTRCLLTCR
jgi:hypothetical protein